jgi:hypothetical protein
MSAILNLPDPRVSVTPGGIFLEWHARGLNIEVRFHENSIYVSVEDPYGNFAPYQGSDIGRALTALCAMEARKP